MDLYLLEAIINGILLGGVLALLALGLNLIFGVIDVVMVKDVSTVPEPRRSRRPVGPQRSRQNHLLLHDHGAHSRGPRANLLDGEDITRCPCISAPGSASAICRRSRRSSAG